MKLLAILLFIIMARRNLTPEQALQYFQELSENESEGGELLESDDDYVPQNDDSTESEDIDEPEDFVKGGESSVIEANGHGNIFGK